MEAEELLSGRERQLQDPRRALLKKLVQERGELWAIAAMIEGSIGYHSYISAQNRIRQLMRDDYIYGCERSYACFRGDSVAEIEHDFKCFLYIEEVNPDRIMRIVSFVERLGQYDDATQSTIGLFYPTMRWQFRGSGDNERGR